MRCLVTGAAGFIGSHLCDTLLSQGHEVIGLDAFIPYYPRPIKERNLAAAIRQPKFRFVEADLRRDACDEHLADVEVVFHLAAMAGLLRSWSHFDDYWTCNAQATERLLSSVQRACPQLRRFIYVSTSSVYGKFASGDETLPTKPSSPYGITKLAGEHLCRAFRELNGLPLVVLRYFSVYGPRQRPEMGYYGFIEKMLRGEEIGVCGDGLQVRSNTYISDCVSATIAAAQAQLGETYNVGGGESANVWDVLGLLEKVSGRKARTRQIPTRPGDQRYTFADTTRLREHLGWAPSVGLEQGLRLQLEWQENELPLGRSSLQ
ncbi:MAG: NAD-dependent epimerase/dehydratase family protein [Pirellulaceae bacterium]